MSYRNPIAAWQKIYDDAHLICSTAIYFETLSNESEALRCWRNALEQLIYQQYTNKVPSSYAPRSETERALLESLRRLEAQCRERVDLLEAVEKSRRESGGNSSDVPTSDDLLGNGGIAGGTIEPMDLHDLAKPPPLPTRPPPASRSISAESANAVADLSLSPKRSRASREPSPEKKSRMKSSLRPGQREKVRSPGSGNSSTTSLQGPAAAKAATQAWATKKSRLSGRRTRMEAHNVHEGMERLEVGGDDKHGKLRKHKQPTWATAEPADPFGDDAELRLANSRSTDSTMEASHRNDPSRSGTSGGHYRYADGHDHQSYANIRRPRHPESAGPRGSRDSPLLDLPPRSSKPSTAPTVAQSTTVAIVTRKPIQGDSSLKPVISNLHGNEALSGEDDFIVDEGDEEEEEEDEDESEDEDEAIEPPSREETWRIFSASLLANLPRGVDKHAAEQILNEVIVQGDEVHWTDIAGLEPAKAALKENVVYPFLRPDLFLGLREPARGMLLFGPPGTGKTMLARAVATEAKSTFFAISASSLIAKFLGESEKLVRALFSLAKVLAPSIIFVDEIDSLLSSRSGEGEHEATRRIKTEFLIQWSDLARAAAGREQSSRERERGDPSRVLVLAATNVPWAIDEAARRRFVRRQYIPLPEKDVRMEQLKTLMKHQNQRLNEEDMNKLVDLTEGFSGSDITALAKDAAMGPLRSLGDQLLSTKTEDIRPIGMQDFVASLQTIRPSVSKEGLQRFEDWAKDFGERGG